MRKGRYFQGWPQTLALLLVLLGVGFPALGQTSGPGPGSPAAGVKEGETPIHITAAQLVADQDRHLILFKGQVKAVSGDATLYADQLWVFYKPRKTGSSPGASTTPDGPASPLADLGGEKLDRLEAKGNVRFVQGDRVATAQQAIYYKDREEIVLTGQPRVWRGENLLKGERLVLHLATRKVVVESSPQQQVEAHLYQTAPAGKGIMDLRPGSRPRAPKPGETRKSPGN